MIFFEYLIIAIVIALVLIIALGLAMIGFSCLVACSESARLIVGAIGILFLCIDFAFVATVLTLTFAS